MRKLVQRAFELLLVMLALLAVAAIFSARQVAAGGGALHAEQIKVLGTVENPQGTRISILDAPCDSAKTMALISGNLPEEMRNDWKKVDAVFAMTQPAGEIQRFEGCWYEVEAGDTKWVLLVFEDGDYFEIPRAAFRRTGLDAKGRNGHAIQA